MQISECRIAGNELCLKTSDFVEARRFAYTFKAGEYEIVRKRKRRSNDANALCWALCTEIANVLRTDKDGIYLDMLKDYGQRKIVLEEEGEVPDEKYYEFLYQRIYEGKVFDCYMVYKGSSKYDTKEMSILLDGIIYEAKNLDISVISEREKSLLLEEWAGSYEVKAK